MKRLVKMSSTAAMIAIVGVGMFVGSKSALAQVKSSVTPDLVRNIDEPGFNPFQWSMNTLFTNPAFTVSVPIPTNKVAVIEHVSASGLLDSIGVVQGFLVCSNGSQEVRHSLVLTPQGTINGFTMWAVSQPIKCYGTTQTASSGGVFVHVQNSAINLNQHTWVVAVSGYLVPQ
jgi:hypothetical protein